MASDRQPMNRPLYGACWGAAEQKQGSNGMIEFEDSDHRQFYALREAQERLAALNCQDPIMKAVHLARAAHFAAKIAARDRIEKL